MRWENRDSTVPECLQPHSRELLCLQATRGKKSDLKSHDIYIYDGLKKGGEECTAVEEGQGLTPHGRRNKMQLPPSQAQSGQNSRHAHRSRLHQLHTVCSGHAQEPHATVFSASSTVSIFHGSFQINTKGLLSLKQSTAYAKTSWSYHNKSLFCEVAGKAKLLFFQLFLINPSCQFIVPINKVNVHSYTNTPHQRIFGQEIMCVLLLTICQEKAQ